MRRGYYNLYIANKAFGSTAAIIAGLTLLIGPLSKKFSILGVFMTIRRQLGLTALLYGLFHIIASLLQAKRFPLFSWYLNEWIPVVMGIIAIGIWIYLFTISSNEKIKQIGVERWKKILSISAQIAFVAIFLHLVIMKYAGWIRWWQGLVKQTPELANPNYPPASLFVLLFIVVVVVYRVVNHIIYNSKSKKLT